MLQLSDRSDNKHRSYSIMYDLSITLVSVNKGGLLYCMYYVHTYINGSIIKSSSPKVTSENSTVEHQHINENKKVSLCKTKKRCFIKLSINLDPSPF